MDFAQSQKIPTGSKSDCVTQLSSKRPNYFFLSNILKITPIFWTLRKDSHCLRICGILVNQVFPKQHKFDISGVCVKIGMKGFKINKNKVVLSNKPVAVAK